MNMLQIPRMAFSFHGGWDEVEKQHPSIARLFLLIALPLSLLPPLMIHYAGLHHGEVFDPNVTSAQWTAAARLFFLAELVTVPAMAAFIYGVARLNRVPASFYACAAIAVLAPAPLWFSSLGLFVPNLMFNLALTGVALLCSVGLIYRGIHALLHMHEDVEALQMATVVAAVGVLAWLLLMQIVLRH